MNTSRYQLPGSSRVLAKNVELLGAADPTERILVSIEVRRKNPLPPLNERKRPFNDYIEFVALHGADVKDLLEVRKFANEHHLKVVSESMANRSIQLTGTIKDINAAFSIDLKMVNIGGKPYRHHHAPISLPSYLKPIVVSVLGTENRPVARPHYRQASPADEGDDGAYDSAFSPFDLAKLYNFPPGDGTGTTIAFVELGGGFWEDDFKTYFQNLHLPIPKFTIQCVAGGSNSPGDYPCSDKEVMLDVEVAGAIAPGAELMIYFAPNTDLGLQTAVKAAVHAPTRPTVVCISWGATESAWLDATKTSVDGYLQDAANLGIPVFASCGDHGSTDGTSGLAVEFPASAPHAVACGGTTITVANNLIASETVWNRQQDGATGGGVSAFFHDKPNYQSNIPVPTSATNATGRGIPDVSGYADFPQGYKIRSNGTNTAMGGTSAVVPLWAGLIARIAPQLGKPLPFLNDFIYQPAVSSAVLRDIRLGNNNPTSADGNYQAATGWDPCTGLGSPNGVALLNALLQRGASPAGIASGAVVPAAGTPVPQDGATPSGAPIQFAPFDKHDWFIILLGFLLLMATGTFLWRSTVAQFDIVEGWTQAASDGGQGANPSAAAHDWPPTWAVGNPGSLYLAAQMQLEKQRYDFGAATLITSAARKQMILFIGGLIIMVGCFVLIRGVRDASTAAGGTIKGDSFNFQTASPAVVIIVVGGVLLCVAALTQDKFNVTDQGLTPPPGSSATPHDISQADADKLINSLPATP